MSAVIVAVGSELLRAGRRDTNAEWLAAELLGLGVVTTWRAAVEDDARRIAAIDRLARAGSEVVLLTGGLGPTEDDRTRDGLALALDRPLSRDPDMVAAIERLFAARGRPFRPVQARQAERPAGTSWIPNPVGTAPGILDEADGCLLAALPGVPAEMRAMFEATVRPRLRSRGTGAIAQRTLRIAGRPEASVEEAVRDLYATPLTDTTILAGSGLVDLVLTATGRDRSEAVARLEALEGAMRVRLTADVFGVDGDTLASAVGRLLAARGATVAVAESCTGGGLGEAITEVPGASAWFRGGLVCYANDLKSSLADVPEETLGAFGAVSEETARALAAGARRRCGATFGLGITGIAGPTGGTPGKPVGTVHVALADDGPGRAVRFVGPPDRALVRRIAIVVALDTLRRRLQS